MQFTASAAFGPSGTLRTASTTTSLSYVCDGSPSPTVSVTPVPTPSPSPSVGPVPIKGVLFNEVADNVAFSKTAVPGLNFGSATSFTVSAYFMATSVAGVDPVIMSDKNWNSGSNPGFVISFNSGGLWGNVASGSARVDLTTSKSVTDGAWHQVVLVVDRTAGVAALYVDGIPIATSALGSLGSVTTTYPVVVGQDGTKTYSELHTATSIDEVRIWSRAFSASEVAASYSPLCNASVAAAPFPSSLLLHARFSEGTGTSTANSAVAGSVGTVGGSGVWQSTQLTCPVLFPVVSVYGVFDAVTDYVAFPKSAPLNFGSATSFTVSAYFKASAVTGDPVIVSDKNWNSGRNTGFVISFNSGGGLWANVGDGTNRIDLKTSASLLNGAWHQAVLVVDRSSAVGALYIDGAAAGSTALGALGSVTNTNPVAVGQDGTLTYSEPHNSTAIDEVRVWSRAFSASEVASSFVPLCTASSAAGTAVPFASSLVLRAKLSEGGGVITADSARAGVNGAVRGSGVWGFAPAC